MKDCFMNLSFLHFNYIVVVMEPSLTVTSFACTPVQILKQKGCTVREKWLVVLPLLLFSMCSDNFVHDQSLSFSFKNNHTIVGLYGLHIINLA